MEFGSNAAENLDHKRRSDRHRPGRRETSLSLVHWPVDQPPLIAVITKITRVLLGDSLAAIRLPSALAGAGLVLLTGFVARELGGRRFAQGFAALGVLLAPAFLGLDSLLTMNAFEPLFWMGCAYVLIRMINSGERRLWLWFGVLAGVGLENKHSMLIFGFAVLAGLLLTERRKLLRGPWLWVAGAVAFLIFAPNLLWNIQHHFPFLELQANIRASHRNVDLLPLSLPSRPQCSRSRITSAIRRPSTCSSPESRTRGSDPCRSSSPINSAGTRWRKPSRAPTTTCLPMFAPRPPSSARATARPARSISSARNTACRKPSAATRTISCGDRAATPAKA
ncbi:MAG: glycosyltransferase family 39 protein [Acidobacteriia bacterium]|nr:glycosyltransferase family 39 protein [Terriglobia bacterium]